MSELPSWAEQALNGGSVRVARLWHLDKLQPGDTLAGKVVTRRKWSLTIACESGTLAGDAIEAGEWMHVETSPAVLQHWRLRDGVDIGDRVVIAYRGQLERGPRGRLDFAAGTFREQTTAPWE